MLSEPIRDRAARSGRIPAAVRTSQPCAGDPRCARRVANAVLILPTVPLSVSKEENSELFSSKPAVAVAKVSMTTTLGLKPFTASRTAAARRKPVCYRHKRFVVGGIGLGAEDRDLLRDAGLDGAHCRLIDQDGRPTLAAGVRGATSKPVEDDEPRRPAAT